MNTNYAHLSKQIDVKIKYPAKQSFCWYALLTWCPRIMIVLRFSCWSSMCDFGFRGWTASNTSWVWRWQLQCLPKRWIIFNIRRGSTPKAEVTHSNYIFPFSLRWRSVCYVLRVKSLTASILCSSGCHELSCMMMSVVFSIVCFPNNLRLRKFIVLLFSFCIVNCNFLCIKIH
jgi:hypothetical protein